MTTPRLFRCLVRQRIYPVGLVSSRTLSLAVFSPATFFLLLLLLLATHFLAPLQAADSIKPGTLDEFIMLISAA